MSPAPLVNCSDTDLVHAPLMSSETLTCPATSYWANQPTRRSPAATACGRTSVVDASCVPGEPAAPWTNCGERPGVVTGTPDDWAEWFPAASNASTAYEYVVAGATVVSVNDVPAVVAIDAPFRYTV